MVQVKIVLVLLLLTLVSVEAKGGGRGGGGSRSSSSGSRGSSSRSSSGGGRSSSSGSKPKGQSWNHLNAAKSKGGRSWNHLAKGGGAHQSSDNPSPDLFLRLREQEKLRKIGRPALAGAVGAVGGLYLGHQMYHWNRDNMDQYYSNPLMGYYGYYDNNQFVRCPPPRAVVINDTLSIPSELNEDYDRRCEYYAEEPPKNYYDDDDAIEIILCFILMLIMIIMMIGILGLILFIIYQTLVAIFKKIRRCFRSQK